jgi:hypothetical protein
LNIQFKTQCRCPYRNQLNWSSTLRHLRIIYPCEFHSEIIQHPLVNLFSLLILEIYHSEMSNRPPDGKIWENIISSSIPLLRHFRFYFIYSSDLIKPIEDIVSSFSTSFYLIKNKWIHSFTNLKQLQFNSLIRISPQNFLCLLKNTPYLDSLTIEKSCLQRATEYWNNVSICNYLSQKILYLDLSGEVRGRMGPVNNNEVQQIIRIFSSKCQHLSLYLRSIDEIIPTILQNMIQLQSLHIFRYGKNSCPIDIISLEKQQTKYNRSNCIIVNDRQNQYFW